MYDMTPDGNPIVDKSSTIKNLYNVAGFSGHGFKLSPVIGHIVSSFVSGNGPDNEYLNMFKKDRFTTGNQIVPDFPYGNRAHQ